jgi:transposase-like protein
VVELYPNDYYKNFDQNDTTQRDADGLLHVELFSITNEKKCPNCGGSKIKKIGFRERKGFIDIIQEGNPVEITFKLQRYLCHDCAKRKKVTQSKSIKTTFTSDCLPPCIEKNKQFSTDMVDAIVKKVAGNRMTIAEAADSMHVSAASVSDIIAKHRKAALEQVVTLEPADVLIVYPFKYGNSERCAILGVAGNRPMLYTILNNCKKKSVQDYLTKTAFDDKSAPCVLLTDYPRPGIHKFLSDLYNEGDIGILRESTFQKMKALRDKHLDRETSVELNKALEELGCIITGYFYDTYNDEYIPIDMENDDFYEFLSDHNINLGKAVRQNFNIMLQNWWDNLSKEMQQILKDIFDGLVANEEKIATGLMYKLSYYDPAVILQCIEKLRRNRVPFNDLLSWLTLVAGVYNKEKITAVQMLSCSYIPKPIHGFYIDLNELNSLLDE